MKFLFVDDENAYEGKIAEKIAFDVMEDSGFDVQTSSRGFGIWGDTKYNPIYQKTKKKYKEIGLFAARIAFDHPTTHERMVFKADPSGEAFDLLEMTE